MAVLVSTTPFAKDVNHFVLAVHRRNPRLAHPREHAADGTGGDTGRVVAGTHPCLSEAFTVGTAIVEFTSQTCHRPVDGPHVIVDQGVDVAVAVVGYTPAGFGTMVAVVDDAHARIDGVADGALAGTTTTVQFVDMLVGVVLQGVADEVDVLVVVFAIVAATSADGTDTQALVDPGEAFRHIALIVKHLVHLIGQMCSGLYRESTDHDFFVVVVAFQLAEPSVGTLATHGMRRDVVIVANEQDENEVALGVVVDAADVVLDLRVAVATGFAHADHGGRTA